MASLNKEEIISSLQAYFEAELGQDLGQFEAGFLLDFLQEKLGPYFYNEGLKDAQAVIHAQLEEIDNQLIQIEKPDPFG